jgi:hypothetical protein
MSTGQAKLPVNWATPTTTSQLGNNKMKQLGNNKMTPQCPDATLSETRQQKPASSADVLHPSATAQISSQVKTHCTAVGTAK